uniref:Predicted gene 9918 n=1 Tax=Cricetulus griseus TaxID=10029 RepID=A0A8C2LRH9_CRIGR
MDFSLGLRLGPRNKKATYQDPPPSSGHGPPATSPCLSCPPSACACPCPSCPPPTCPCNTCPSYTGTCPSCPVLPGPPCTCSCPPCPVCPPSTCPHNYCVPCSSSPMTHCHHSPCPSYPCSAGQTACQGSHLACSSSCSCGRGTAWKPRGSTGCCSFCFRRQRASQGLCLII